jgi:hypothetical protein
MRTIAGLFFVLILSSACSQNHVSTGVQSFAAADRLNNSDRVFVIFDSPSQSGSLEHETYLNLVREQLSKRNIVIADRSETASAVAVLSLNIDTGRDTVSGYDLAVWTNRIFVRRARLVIARPTPNGAPRRVFESQAISEGNCALLASIAPQMIEAIFTTFPEGGTKNVRLSHSGNC